MNNDFWKYTQFLSKCPRCKNANYTRHLCYRAVRVLQLATPTVTRDVCLKWSPPRTRDTHTCCRALGSEALTAFLTTQVCRDRRSNPDLRQMLERKLIFQKLTVPFYLEDYFPIVQKYSMHKLLCFTLIFTITYQQSTTSYFILQKL